jgi:sulfate adenylyltransferase
VVGFQTRNPVHAAHEYLQRRGLDICDGLFINPSVGWKKKGDFSQEAIEKAYACMIKEFYPKNRVHMEGLKIFFRYAGPREAIFHALIRRNLGCTHFIIGRDHAGVGNYYGTYEAQELALKLSRSKDMGITLLLFKEPYFCKRCGTIVTEKHCSHRGKDIVYISGTLIRDMLGKGKYPDSIYMRPEITGLCLN